MHLSSDGKLLFASTEDGKMVEYTVDALSGFLTQAGSIDAGTEGFGKFIVSSDGKNIYFNSGSEGIYSASALPQIPYTGNSAEIGKYLSGSDADVEDYKDFSITIERNGGANASDGLVLPRLLDIPLRTG